jgi:hypothetical protein
MRSSGDGTGGSQNMPSSVRKPKWRVDKLLFFESRTKFIQLAVPWEARTSQYCGFFGSGLNSNLRQDRFFGSPQGFAELSFGIMTKTMMSLATAPACGAAAGGRAAD